MRMLLRHTRLTPHLERFAARSSMHICTNRQTTRTYLKLCAQTQRCCPQAGSETSATSTILRLQLGGIHPGLPRMQLQLQCYDHHTQLSTGLRRNSVRLHSLRVPCQRQIARGHQCAASCGIKARWCVDIRYGVKMEAIVLLQEWVQDIGSQLEVELDSLAQLETFWGQIPPKAHKAWSQRAQHFLIDGSPQWEVYRNVPVLATGAPGPVASQPVVEPVLPQTESGLIIPDFTQPQEVIVADMAPDESEEAVVHDDNVMLDWKGDPMQINPGDRLPFNFK